MPEWFKREEKIKPFLVVLESTHTRDKVLICTQFFVHNDKCTLKTIFSTVLLAVFSIVLSSFSTKVGFTREIENFKFLGTFIRAEKSVHLTCFDQKPGASFTMLTVV